jgi:hypothetical protein
VPGASSADASLNRRVRDSSIAVLDDADDAVSCEWCRWPILEGEARLRFFAIAFHLRCWDASVEALRVSRRRE